MTVREYVVIHCNEPKCRATWPGGSMRLWPGGWIFAREKAADDGWTQGRMGGDYCPKHPPASPSPLNPDTEGRQA